MRRMCRQRSSRGCGCLVGTLLTAGLMLGLMLLTVRVGGQIIELWRALP